MFEEALGLYQESLNSLLDNIQDDVGKSIQESIYEPIISNLTYMEDIYLQAQVEKARIQMLLAEAVAIV